MRKVMTWVMLMAFAVPASAGFSVTANGADKPGRPDPECCPKSHAPRGECVLTAKNPDPRL